MNPDLNLPPDGNLPGDSALPVGLQAAAAQTVAGVAPGAELVPAAPAAPVLDLRPLARGSIKMLVSWAEAKHPCWKTSEAELDALGDAWGPVLQMWLDKAPGPLAVAAITTGVYAAPRIAQLALERRKKAAPEDDGQVHERAPQVTARS